MTHDGENITDKFFVVMLLSIFGGCALGVMTGNNIFGFVGIGIAAACWVANNTLWLIGVFKGGK